jgi:hypothetical protein
MTREEIIAAVRAGKSLAEASLRGANLRGANLREANLREADLQKASFYGANLQGASLQGADLYQADLSEANLREADLQGVYMPEASLRGADLQEADLLFMLASDAKTTGIKLSWVPKKGDLVKIRPEYANFNKSTIGTLLEDPDPNHIFNPVSVRLHDREIEVSITDMKPASKLEKIIQEELKRELKR